MATKMQARRRSVLALLTLAVMVTLAAAPSTAHAGNGRGQQKVDVCHTDDDGVVKRLTVAAAIRIGDQSHLSFKNLISATRVGMAVRSDCPNNRGVAYMILDPAPADGPAYLPLLGGQD